MRICLLLILGMLTGCQSVIFHGYDDYEKSLVKSGVSPFHASSCGPRALVKLQDHFGKSPSTKTSISRDISSHAFPLSRFGGEALSLFDRRFLAITWPGQMVGFCIRHGYSVERYASTKKDDVARLDEDIVGFVLIKVTEDAYGNKSDLLFHWEFFSTRAELLSVYDFSRLGRMSSIYLVTLGGEKG